MTVKCFGRCAEILTFHSVCFVYDFKLSLNVVLTDIYLDMKIYHFLLVEQLQRIYSAVLASFYEVDYLKDTNSSHSYEISRHRSL